MQRFWWIIIALGGSLLIGAVSIWLVPFVSNPSKPYIVCTTGIVADTVANIAGDAADVACLMGPGVDPHVFRASEQDMQRFAAADVIFYNGLHLEGKMDDVFAHMRAYTTTVPITRDMPHDKLRASPFSQVYDPHVWFDVQLWQYTIDTITSTLQEVFPEYASIFTENAERYRESLARLDAYVREQVNALDARQRRLVTAHDAFEYFARAYDFDVVGLQGISTDSQVGTYDIQSLAAYIVRHKVATIFTEASIPERHIQAVKQAVAARGHTVAIGDQLYSDTLGPPGSDAATYIDMVTYNVQTIVQALYTSG